MSVQPKTYKSKREIISALKKYAKECDRLTHAWLKCRNMQLAKRAEREFGSWTKALKAAGLNHAKFIAWTPDKVVKQIKARHKKGKNLSDSYMKVNYAALYRAGIRLMGSWPTAIKKSGIDYTKIKQHTKQRDMDNIVADIIEWSRKYGPVCASKLKETDEPLLTAIYRHKTTPKKLSEDIGLEYINAWDLKRRGNT